MLRRKPTFTRRALFAGAMAMALRPEIPEPEIKVRLNGAKGANGYLEIWHVPGGQLLKYAYPIKFRVLAKQEARALV